MENFIVFQKQNNNFIPVSVTGEIFDHSVEIQQQDGTLKTYNSGGIDLQKLLISDVLLAYLQDYNLTIIPLQRSIQYAEQSNEKYIEAMQLKYQSFINSLKTSISTIQTIIKSGQKITPEVLQKIQEIKKEFSEPLQLEVVHVNLAKSFDKPIEVDVQIFGKNHKAMVDTGAQVCLLDSAEFSKKIADQSLKPDKDILISGISGDREKVPLYSLDFKVKKGSLPNQEIEGSADFGLLNGLKIHSDYNVLLDRSVFNYIMSTKSRF